MKTRPPQGAQAALRAVRLLKLFTNERSEMSLAQISRASGLNKTTTHRLLRALQSESLIDRNPATSAYSLGAGLMALGVQALASSDLRRRSQPYVPLRARRNDNGARRVSHRSSARLGWTSRAEYTRHRRSWRSRRGRFRLWRQP